MKKEKENVIEVSGLSYDKSAIQSLLQRGEEMEKEIASLKRQIGGYKTANKRCKKQSQEDVSIILSLQSQNQDLVAKVKEKEHTISKLQEKMSVLNADILKYQTRVEDVIDERDVAIANYDYVCGLPWYKRMFFDGK